MLFLLELACGARGLADFWLVLRSLVLLYLLLDVGSCLFLACSSQWIRRHVSELGRSFSILGIAVASWGLVLYLRAFGTHVSHPESSL